MPTTCPLYSSVADVQTSGIASASKIGIGSTTDGSLSAFGVTKSLTYGAAIQGATSVLFFEARKRSDLYMWMSKAPSGPSVRFLCSNVHTMAELKLSGNHLKGSRPVVALDAAFDEQPQLQVRVSQCWRRAYPSKRPEKINRYLRPVQNISLRLTPIMLTDGGTTQQISFSKGSAPTAHQGFLCCAVNF
jgi:hypothetical protein